MDRKVWLKNSIRNWCHRTQNNRQRIEDQRGQRRESLQADFREKRAGKARAVNAIQETDRHTTEAGLQVEGPSALDGTGSHVQDPKTSREKEM